MASSNYSLLISNKQVETLMASSNYSLLISSKFSIRLSPMTHSRRQHHPVVLKESGGFLGFSGLKAQKGLGCSIHARNPSFGWGSEMGKEKSVKEDDAGINGSTEKLGSSMSAEIGNDVAEPFFYNEAERRYYYFVKGFATTVRESLKSLMKALMVVPLCFAILAFVLKNKVDVVMKTVSSQEDSDEDIPVI